MAVLDAATVANKWATRLSGATEDIKRGVAAVTEAPGVAAARQKTLWLQKITANADKWARRVSAVSLQDWQTAMNDKGIGRIAGGATAAIPKMTAFMQDFLPYVEQGAGLVRSMPKGDVESGVNRAAAMIRHNAKYVRKG
jgi:hypothetical protein